MLQGTPFKPTVRRGFFLAVRQEDKGTRWEWEFALRFSNCEDIMLDRNRRKKRAKIVVEPKTREELERLFGRVWSQQELARDFILTSIVGLTVIVRRKADDMVGSLDYQNAPRLYYNFRPMQSSN